MKFGNRLKQARQKQQVTQQRVADDLNVSRQTISSWETENSYPDIESLIQLSNYYQISLDTLLKEDTGMTEYLKKQEVLKSIKPVTLLLTVIDIMFIAVICSDMLGIVKFNSWVIRLVFAMGILNVVALILLRTFMRKVSIKPVNYQKRIPIYAVMIVIFIVASIVLGYSGQSGVAGIFGGIAFGGIVILLMDRKRK